MDKSGSIKNGFVPFVPYGYIDISSKIKKGDEKLTKIPLVMEDGSNF